MPKAKSIQRLNLLEVVGGYLLVLHLVKEASSLGAKVQVGELQVLEAAHQLEEEELQVLVGEVLLVEEFQEEEFQVVERQEEVKKD